MDQPSVVDTNVILRFLLGDHREHSEEARLFFDEVKGGERLAYIGEAIWAECFFLMTKTYGIARSETLEKLEKLSSFRGMVGDHRSMLVRAFALTGKYNVSFVDALAFALAEERGWDLITFDKKLKRVFAARSGN